MRVLMCALLAALSVSPALADVDPCPRIDLAELNMYGQDELLDVVTFYGTAQKKFGNRKELRTSPDHILLINELKCELEYIRARQIYTRRFNKK